LLAVSNFSLKMKSKRIDRRAAAAMRRNRVAGKHSVDAIKSLMMMGNNYLRWSILECEYSQVRMQEIVVSMR
jgi:hypothetical protein